MSLHTTSVHSGSSYGNLFRTLALGSAIALSGGGRGLAQESTIPIPPDNEPVATVKEEAPEQKPVESPYLKLLHCASDIGMGYYLGYSAKNRLANKQATSQTQS